MSNDPEGKRKPPSGLAFVKKKNAIISMSVPSVLIPVHITEPGTLPEQNGIPECQVRRN